MSTPDRTDEARRILQLYGPDRHEPIFSLLERQFATLTTRAQVLLALCGIVISTTGFSGRLVASTGPAAKTLVFAGVGLILAAAAIVCAGVLSLRWLTQHPGQIDEDWLIRALTYRDRKTAYYRLGMVVLIVGLTLYVAALLVMLYHPTAAPPMHGIR